MRLDGEYIENQDTIFIVNTRKYLYGKKIFTFVLIVLFSSFGLIDASLAEDCATPNSTSQNIQCAAKAFEASDLRLNETYNRTLALFSGKNQDQWYPETTKEHLISAEKIWIKYRDENCTAISWNYKSGSIQEEMELLCKRDLTEQRIKALSLFSGPG